MNWEEYAAVNPLGQGSYIAEPVQQMRVETIAQRCHGSVLDVGAGDGYASTVIKDAGHPVHVVDISEVRVRRATQEYGLPAEVGDATSLAFEDESFDTVVLAEILEHLDNPGAALAEACRVAKDRVIVTLPLHGWEDPTHRWRIRLDVVCDPAQRAQNPTKGEQIVLTFQRGPCWPPGYANTDPTYQELYE